MTYGEVKSRHDEALRLFEAGLRAFYEATSLAAAPPASDLEEELPAITADALPPAPAPEQPRA